MSKRIYEDKHVEVHQKESDENHAALVCDLSTEEMYECRLYKSLVPQVSDLKILSKINKATNEVTFVFIFESGRTIEFKHDDPEKEPSCSIQLYMDAIKNFEEHQKDAFRLIEVKDKAFFDKLYEDQRENHVKALIKKAIKGGLKNGSSSVVVDSFKSSNTIKLKK